MRGNLSNEIVSIKIEEGSKRPIALHEKSKFGKIEANFLQLSLKIDNFFYLLLF